MLQESHLETVSSACLAYDKTLVVFMSFTEEVISQLQESGLLQRLLNHCSEVAPSNRSASLLCFFSDFLSSQATLFQNSGLQTAKDAHCSSGLAEERCEYADFTGVFL